MAFRGRAWHASHPAQGQAYTARITATGCPSRQHSPAPPSELRTDSNVHRSSRRIPCRFPHAGRPRNAIRTEAKGRSHAVLFRTFSRVSRCSGISDHGSGARGVCGPRTACLRRPRRQR